MTDWPMRELRDPATLRALAHPIRLRILQELGIRGPSTATELAEAVGESPANCSWHLRQLARYGYIEEAGGGTGRQRPWRLVPRGNTWGENAEEVTPELAVAQDAATDSLIDTAHAGLRDWRARRRQEPEEWQRGSFLTQNIAFLTADELHELHEAVNAVILAHQERLADPATRPAGARPVHLMAWGFPSAPTGAER
jgi:DNA-binding transcriptional ArsR family regulator